MLEVTDIARRQHLRFAGCHQLFVPRTTSAFDVSSGTGAFLRPKKQERYETSWRTIGRDDSYPVLGRSEP